MTPDQVDAQRKRDRVESMTPDRAEAQRKSRRLEAMTPDRAEAERQRQRDRNRLPRGLQPPRPPIGVNNYKYQVFPTGHKPISQSWDHDNPCPQ